MIRCRFLPWYQRDPYLYQIATFDYEYLVDSLEQWDIHDIMSESLDSLFINPLTPKCQVYSVEENSPAAKNGILAGDQVISLADEMDMAIAILDKEKRELQFAGANNPLYLIRNREQLNGNEPESGATVETDNSLLFELKGDKQPIGIHWEETDFTSQLIKLQEHDTIYLFSDGYVDQYGGENRKKFKTPRFKELLLSVQAESMDRQKQLIDNAFESWRGNIEQIDDVCVIGLRI